MFLLKNWRNLGNKTFTHFIFIACLYVFFLYGYAHAETKPIGINAKFPDLTFHDILSKEEQVYVGISGNTGFSFKKIPGTLFVFEVFSTYCASCPKNVPILNNVYSGIENNSKLKKKAKVIGIAIGNNQKEVESFKKEYKVQYPVLTDFNFASHKALGNPRVPYTIIVRRDARGKGIVVNTHQGIIDSAENIMDKIRDFIQCDPSLLKKKKALSK